MPLQSEQMVDEDVVSEALAAYRQEPGDSDYDVMLAAFELVTRMRNFVADDNAAEVCLRILEQEAHCCTDETLGAELERRCAVWAVDRLARIAGQRRCSFDLNLNALEALASGQSCVCDVYRKARAERLSPHMTVEHKANDDLRYTTTQSGSCMLCKQPWQMVHHSVDRGHDLYEWT